MPEFVRAVGKTAWWLEENIGQSTVHETMAYIGPSDLRYAIIFLAAVKYGYKVKVFLNKDAVMRLKSTASCTIYAKLRLDECIPVETNQVHHFLYAIEMSQKVHELQAKEEDLRILEVELVGDMLYG